MAESENRITKSTILGNVVQIGRVVLPTASATVATLADWMRLSGFLADNVPDQFTGRVWLTEEIDRFLTTRSRGYVIIEADGGLGKTALAAWLAAERHLTAHFSRLPNGHLAAVALRHLGAQLIKDHGLDTFAPGGVLGPEAGEPAWFDQVLREAASRQPDRPLILVVDGLDEGEPAAGRFPLGLPPTLPEGVHVLVTCRTGTELPGLRQPYQVLRIRADDPRNLDDMREHLAVLARGSFADLLARDAIAPGRFADELTGRCAGVWIYQRQVLEELRLGTRTAAQLDGLPGDLGNYYRDDIGLLREDVREWDELYLPLLSAFAVAAEPVTFATLAGLAGVEPGGRARAFVDRRLRPFLTVDGDGRYGIYHSSLRDFLSGAWDFSELASAASLRDELRTACRAAHHRVVERYLAAWGGLDSALPELAADPHLANMDDRYGLLHLVDHLVQAGRRSDVHRLLALEHESALQTRANTWYVAHNTVNTLDGYLGDIHRARRFAEEATDHQYEAGEPAAGIGLEIRYALIQASIATLSNTIPKALVARLVQTGRWKPDRAFAHIGQIGDAAERALALAGIIAHLPDPMRDLAVRQAVDATSRIVNGRNLIGVVEDLAPLLRETEVGELLARVAVFDEEHVQTPCLVALAGRGPDGALPGLLERARDLGDGLLTAEVCAAALGRMPATPLLTEIFSLLDAVPEGPRKAAVLGTVIPYLPPEHRAVATIAVIVGAAGVERANDQAKLLAPVAPHFSGPVLDSARKLVPGNANGCLDLAATLALHLLPDAGARARALANARQIDGPPPDLRAKVAAEVPPAAFERALDETEPAEETRARVIENLAPYLPAAVLPHAVRMARSLPSVAYRTKALVALVPRLTGKDREPVVREALDGTVAIDTGWNANELRARLAPYLRHGQLTRALHESVDRELRGPGGRRNVPGTLAALAPFLPPALLADALTIATTIDDRPDHAHTLAACTPLLSDPYRSVMAAEATEIATGVEDINPRAVVLASVAAALPPRHRDRAIDAFFFALAGASPGYWVEAALRSLAPALRQLPGEAMARLRAQAGKAHIGAGLIRAVAADLPPEMLSAAADFLASLSDTDTRSQLAAELIPHLAGTVAPEKLLDLVEDVRYDNLRAESFAGIAGRLPPEHLARATGIALRVRGVYQARALAALIPRMTGMERAAAVQAALAVIASTDRRLPPNDDEYATQFVPQGDHPDMVALPPNDPDCAGILIDLLPGLTDAELGFALTIARSLGAPGRRTRALIAIASRMPGADQLVLAEAFKAYNQIDDPYVCLSVLTAFARSSPDPIFTAQARELTRYLTAEHKRFSPLLEFLREIAPVRPDALWEFAEPPAHAVTRHDVHLAGLKHAEELHWNTTAERGFGPVRHCFANLPRKQTFGLLRACVDLISAEGGTKAVFDCAQAIRDVTAWWP